MHSKLSFFFTFLAGITFSQNFTLSNQRMIGTSGSDESIGIIKTSDGGSLLPSFTGSQNDGDHLSTSYGSLDFWIIKLDASNQIEWEKSYGGSNYESIRNSSVLSDGSYILSGLSLSDSSGVKTSPNYGGSDLWIIKIDANGQKIWDKSFGTSIDDDGGYVTLINDTIYLLGTTTAGIDGTKTLPSYGGTDLWLIALDTAGNELFQRVYGGGDYEFLTGGQVITVHNNKLIIIASSYSGISGNKTTLNYGNMDTWLLELNHEGTVIHEQNLGGGGNDLLRGIVQVDENKFFLSGSSTSPISGNKTAPLYGVSDAWLVQLDSSFNIVSQTTFGGSQYNGFNDIIKLNNDHFLASGWSSDTLNPWKTRTGWGSNDFYLVGLDENGNYEWNYSFGGTGYDDLTQIKETGNGELKLLGITQSSYSGDLTVNNHGSYDIFVCDLAVPLSVASINKEQFDVYPNPFENTLYINAKNDVGTLSLCDQTGKIVKAVSVNNGNNSVDLSELESGVYFLQQGKTAVARVVKL